MLQNFKNFGGPHCFGVIFLVQLRSRKWRGREEEESDKKLINEMRSAHIKAIVICE